MIRKRQAGFVTIMGMLLASCLVPELFFIMRLSQNDKRITWHYIPDGDSDEILFILFPFINGFFDNGTRTKEMFSISTYCDCKITNGSFNRPCFKSPFSQSGLNKFLTYGHVTFLSDKLYLDVFALDLKWRLKQMLVIDCNHFDHISPAFGYMFIAASIQKFLSISAEHPNALVEHFSEHLSDHDYNLLPSGSLNKLLITKRVFQQFGEIMDEKNTKFDVHVSHTGSMNSTYTQFTIGWMSREYLMVKEEKVKMWRKLGVFIVTAILSLERFIAFSKRMLSN